ncbi:LRR receptor-like serine/threonine-protein kinase FLS2 [Panicum miliaceum]|uniref:LRR receptor-like serine/threonine-protein kinase FLS2 n=1 Tax=Panicum miliaceum TaxID=4540 RepID=A0A3L6QLD9_PANMI|nr:LRR receptor-like serine/threonine-protein kinase FLS2 [Panicum miliaceum]
MEVHSAQLKLVPGLMVVFRSPTWSWYGVTCDGAGHVAKLRLSNAGLEGTLHVFYSTAFQNLIELYLDDNNFDSTIPAAELENFHEGGQT